MSTYSSYSFETVRDLFLPVFGTEAAETYARTLCERFFTFSRIIRQRYATLVPLIGKYAALYLTLSSALAVRSRTEKMRVGRPVGEKDVTDYFGAFFLTADVEQVCALFSDAEDRLLAVRPISEGTVNASPVLPRAIGEEALRLGATYVRLAHNHPGGDTSPSAEDVAATSAVRALLDTLGVRLVAHYIVSEGAVSDMLKS